MSDQPSPGPMGNQKRPTAGGADFEMFHDDGPCPCADGTPGSEGPHPDCPEHGRLVSPCPWCGTGNPFVNRAPNLQPPDDFVRCTRAGCPLSKEFVLLSTWNARGAPIQELREMGVELKDVPGLIAVGRSLSLQLEEVKRAFQVERRNLDDLRMAVREPERDILPTPKKEA